MGVGQALRADEAFSLAPHCQKNYKHLQVHEGAQLHVLQQSCHKGGPFLLAGVPSCVREDHPFSQVKKSECPYVWCFTDGQRGGLGHDVDSDFGLKWTGLPGGTC